MTLWMGPVYKCRVGEFVNLPVIKTTEGLGENRLRGRSLYPERDSKQPNKQTNKQTDFQAQTLISSHTCSLQFWQPCCKPSMHLAISYPWVFDFPTREDFHSWNDFCQDLCWAKNSEMNWSILNRLSSEIGKEILNTLERKAKFKKYELSPNFLESIFSLVALKVLNFSYLIWFSCLIWSFQDIPWPNRPIFGWAASIWKHPPNRDFDKID